MREWLSGGASPCQGEGRGFESRLALLNNTKRISEWISFFCFEKIVLFEKICYKYDIGCQVMFAIVVKK